MSDGRAQEPARAGGLFGMSQAIAIGLNEAREKGAKVPSRKSKSSSRGRSAK